MTELDHVCVAKQFTDPEYLGVGAVVTRCAICSVSMPSTESSSEFMDDLKKATEADVTAFRMIVLRHEGEPRPALYGRAGTMEQRCRECNKPSPCPSWKLANDRLQVLR